MKPYDKRDGFSFFIVRMPYSCSTIPSAMLYPAFGVEILRIACVTSSDDSFIFCGKDPVSRMKKQGAQLQRMRRAVVKIFANHVHSFSHIFKDPF